MRKESACGIVLLACTCACAQTPPSPTLTAPATAMRAVFLESDLRVEAGEFCIRGPGNEVFRYRFDAKTRVERRGSSTTTTISLLHPGETLEIVSSSIPDSPLRYAVSVLAVDPLPTPRIAPHPRTLTLGTQIESQFRRGDMTFSGVVSFLADGRLILRTRNSGEQTILLRQDTRFLESGNVVRGSDLKANMRVFVRAGRDLFGHTEAYQVMWGGFLQPHIQ